MCPRLAMFNIIDRLDNVVIVSCLLTERRRIAQGAENGADVRICHIRWRLMG